MSSLTILTGNQAYDKVIFWWDIGKGIQRKARSDLPVPQQCPQGFLQKQSSIHGFSEWMLRHQLLSPSIQEYGPLLLQPSWVTSLIPQVRTFCKVIAYLGHTPTALLSSPLSTQLQNSKYISTLNEVPVLKNYTLLTPPQYFMKLNNSTPMSMR